MRCGSLWIKVICTLAVFVPLNEHLFAQPNYLNYYGAINRAEAFIFRSKFDSAAIEYRRAFEQYGTPFFSDLKNALVCQIQLKKFDEALNLARQMVRQGAEIKFFDTEYYKPFRESKEWSTLKAEYGKDRNLYTSKLDTAYRKQLLNLIRTDQYYTKYGSNRQADSTYYFNAIQFLNLVSKNGFPSIYSNNDSLKLLSTLFIHFYKMQLRVEDDQFYYTGFPYNQMAFDTLKLVERMEEWCKKGLLPPNVIEMTTNFSFQGNLSMEGKYGRIALKFNLDNEEVEVKFPQGISLERVNSNRNRVGLPLLNDYHKEFLKTIWVDFDFTGLKNSYCRCKNDSDQHCFNDLLYQFRQLHFEEKLGRFDGFSFSNLYMPNMIFRVDLKFRQQVPYGNCNK